MTEVIAILSVALLSVVFALTQKNRGGCRGPDDCEDTDSSDRCPGCPRH